MSGIALAIPASGNGDHFLDSLVHALADLLIQNGMSLITKVIADGQDEEQLYRHWARVGGISGVVLLEVRANDHRVKLLRSLGIPFAAVVDATLEVDFPAVIVDLAASISVLRRFLAARPHRRAFYITRPVERVTTLSNTALIEAIAADDLFDVVETEHSVDAALTTGSTASATGPVTLVFDSDVHAVAALAAFHTRGISVPEDVAIVSWTNSALCQSARRSITALDRRGGEIGTLIGARIIGAIAGDQVSHDRAPEPFIIVGETA